MQTANKKLRVAVLYGGKSGEHEVSLHSANAVIRNLDRARFDIVPISIDKQGQWFLNDLAKIYLPEEKALLVHDKNSQALQASFVTHAGHDKYFDVIFPVMHGPLYEDGGLQGLLEIANVPYVGSGVLASAMAMDKAITKQLIQGAGIPVVPFLTLDRRSFNKESQTFFAKVEQQLGFPVMVKPARLGSSVGMHKVTCAQELTAALAEAFQFDTKVLVEKALDPREVEISVLENLEYDLPPKVSVAGEIVVNKNHDFYSYEAKYLDPKGAELVIPAELNATQQQQIQSFARQAFSLLECEGMARVDFFIDKSSGDIFFNELNTLPGFTEISMYPKLWVASGLAYSELLSYLIDLALARYARSAKIKRDNT